MTDLTSYIGFTSFSLLLTAMGAGIVFGGGIDWMYQEGLWRRPSKEDEASDRRFRKVRGWGFFITGLILLIVQILGPFIWGN